MTENPQGFVRPTRSLMVALAILAGTAGSAQAQARDQAQQDQDQAPDSAQSKWSGQTSLGANLSFGSTRQYTVNAQSGLQYEGQAAELAGSVNFSYGEATNEGGETFVIRRSWRGAISADFKPTSRVSPFLFGAVESSFETRIDSRVNGGVGAKVAFVRDDVTRLDLSGAILAERTDPRVAAASEDEVDTSLRGSLRLRARRTLDAGRITLSLQTFVRPKLTDMSRYTFEVESSLDLTMTKRLGLRISFLDKYDSEARDRGATSNNDGLLILGLTTSF